MGKSTDKNKWTMTYTPGTKYKLTCLNANFSEQEMSVKIPCGGKVMTDDLYVNVAATTGSGNLNKNLTASKLTYSNSTVYQEDNYYYFTITSSNTFSSQTVTDFTKGWFESSPSGDIYVSLGAKVPQIIYTKSDNLPVENSNTHGTVVYTYPYGQTPLMEFDGYYTKYLLMAKGFNTACNIKINACNRTELQTVPRAETGSQTGNNQYEEITPPSETLYSKVKIRKINLEANIDGFKHSEIYTTTEQLVHQYELVVVTRDETKLWYGTRSGSLSNSVTLSGGGIIFFDYDKGYWYYLNYGGTSASQLTSSSYTNLYLKTNSSSGQGYRLVTPILGPRY